MQSVIRHLLTTLALLTTGFAWAAEPPADPSRFVTTRFTVDGAVENRLDLEVEDLAQFPPQQIGELPLVCQTGANLNKLEQLKGVLLRDILEQAVIKAPEHNDVKKMVVVATASDGYKVVFSWSELFNSPLGEGVIVFFEKDGQPLADNEGRIALVSAKDIRSGPRHIKWLQSIEVRKIVD